MKSTVLTLLLALAILPGTAPAAIIATSDLAPTDFLSDAFSTTQGSAYRILQSGSNVGQSFTHTTDDGNPWRLSSITFRAYTDTLGSETESASGLTLNVWNGNGVGGTSLGSFTFTTATFDSTANTYMTFALTPSESATVGDLTSGSIYTVTLNTGVTAADFRIHRSEGSSYAAGNGVFNNGVRANDDAAFWVAAVPEPSTLALLGISGLAVLTIRRRLHG